MEITVFYYRDSFFNTYRRTTEESEKVYTESALKKYLKTAFSAMKKNDFRGVTFRIEANSGFYMVIDSYDAQSEAFKTIYHAAWNSAENPVMMSQRNITSWALDVWKTEQSENETVA